LKKYNYWEAVQMLRNGRKIALDGSLTTWDLDWVPADGSNVPYIRRNNRGGLSGPWQPTGANILRGLYVIADGGPETENVVLDQGSYQEAMRLAESGQTVRRTDWTGGLRTQALNGSLRLVLPNGTMVDEPYRPDFFDVVGKWELFNL
jgi:hypothetical protein